MPLPLALRRFLRYAVVGCLTFALDFTLLVLATTFTPVPYPLAVYGAFLTGASLNYVLSRRYVFQGTRRKVSHGYLVMLGVAGGGACVTTLLTVALVESLSLHPLLGRVVVAGVVGCASYLFHLHVNFKVAGRHLALVPNTGSRLAASATQERPKKTQAA